MPGGRGRPGETAMGHTRRLVAFLGERTRDAIALLRFPPGVTLGDAGYDWNSLAFRVQDPMLPLETVERLRGLGVEIAAIGPEAVSKALRRASIKGARASLGAFAEDYLDTNARLCGERCVTIHEYAMHTKIGRKRLGDALRHRLLSMEGVRVYRDMAFRLRRLPRFLRLPVLDLVCDDFVRAHVPCMLHGDRCDNYDLDIYRPDLVILDTVRRQHLRARVTVPRRLLDGMFGHGRHTIPRAAAAREIARLVLDALPDDAWETRYLRATDVGRGIAFLVASATARTCEEYTMLVQALRNCRSAREMVLRARDESWVVSRTLESLGDRR